MEPCFYTTARNGLPSSKLALRVVDQPSELWLRLRCFKLVLFHEGVGTIRLGATRVPVVSPLLLCLNARESAQVPASPKCRAVLFLPDIVNAAVSADALEAPHPNGLEVSGQLDLYWAEAFGRRRRRGPRLFDLRPCAARNFSDRFARIESELGRQDCRFWASWARSFLIECLFLTAQLHHAPTQDAERPVLDPDHPATPVVQFLQTRYGERITLARLAREFHTNRTTLQQQFSALTGKSVGAFLREQRLSIARSFLAETTLSAPEIAERTGFSDRVAFSRSFRKAYRLGPSRYRRARQSSSS